MSDSFFVRSGVVHINAESREWKEYCGYLENKLRELEEQKKTIEARIGEVYRALHPEVKAIEEQIEARAEVKETAPATTSTEKCEKYLLVKDIAVKYKVTAVSVETACRGNLIPYHWNGTTKEYRFTPEDVEKITSIQSRKRVFTPAAGIQNPEPKIETLIGDNPDWIGVCEVSKVLGVKPDDVKRLKSRGYLTNIVAKQNVNGTHGYAYSKQEVLELKELAQMEGGIRKLTDSCRVYRKGACE